MRTIVAPDELPALDALLEQRARCGADLYDYEIEGVLRMSRAPRRGHGRWQLKVGTALTQRLDAEAFSVGGPANLGTKGNYVVPDVVVLHAADEPDDEGGVWLGRAAIAVEVLSPDEDEPTKVADYRRVVETGDLALDELWYVDANAAEIRVYDPTRGVARRSSVFLSLDDLTAALFDQR